MRAERAIWWVDAIAKYLFMILLAGLVGGMAGNFIDAALGARTATARQWGWIAGALIAAIGYPLGYVTYGGKKKSLPFKFSERTTTGRARWRGRRQKQLGVWKSTWSGALAGLILGLLLGAALVMVWFSIGLSPFAPEGWLGASTSRASVGPVSGIGVHTRNPMPVVLIFGSGGALAVVGGVGGLIFGVVSKVRRRKEREGG